MKSFRKKIGGIFLIMCLAAPLFTTYGRLQINKFLLKDEIKHRIIAGISPEQLLLLKFHNNELNRKIDWEEENEFQYNRRMFDVVRTKTTADSTFYWCFPDDEETQINRQITKLVDTFLGNDLQHKENQKRLLTFYLSPYFLSVQYWTFLDNQKDEILFSYNFDLQTCQISPPVPPPKFLRHV